MVSFSVLINPCRGLRTLRQIPKIDFTASSKDDTVRTIVDDLLKFNAADLKVNFQVMGNSTSLNSKNDVLVGDPKLVQNRVVALSADIASKWNENSNIKKQLRKFYCMTTKSIFL